MSRAHRLPLRQVRIENFKALHKMGALSLGPLTVFIGNNGSGKSSLIEALETVRRLALEDLDRALEPFRGYEHARYKGGTVQARTAPGERLRSLHPIRFEFRGHIDSKPYSAALSIAERENNEIFFQEERVSLGKAIWERDAQDKLLVQRPKGSVPELLDIPPQDSILAKSLKDFLEQWQFVRLSPEAMGAPVSMQRSGREIRLEPNGSNVAQYLLSLQQQSPVAFDGLTDAAREVLPYATDIQPRITSELDRNVYLRLAEQKFEVPGWMLSTGTLRVLALLALFRHPKAPPLVFIEELENGLDPRTLALVVNEIRGAVLSGRQQVVVTTHSPYLLDLFDLSHIVLVERQGEGAPTFRRPADDEQLAKWASEFGYGPGTLYTRGQLGRGGGK